MKAVTWHGKRDVRVETVSDPAIEDPTDVIVRVTSSGIFLAPQSAKSCEPRAHKT
jgi:threonine dehydrogenase-like Zn-dependent dehydrogenase